MMTPMQSEPAPLLVQPDQRMNLAGLLTPQAPRPSAPLIDPSKIASFMNMQKKLRPDPAPAPTIAGPTQMAGPDGMPVSSSDQKANGLDRLAGLLSIGPPTGATFGPPGVANPGTVRAPNMTPMDLAGGMPF